jgi:alpha-1,2-mannosyltransferase
LKDKTRVCSQSFLLSLDITFPVPIAGYHALTPTTFSAAMHEILMLSFDEQLALRSRARRLAVERFSEQEFVKGWDSCGWKTFLDKLLL